LFRSPFNIGLVPGGPFVPIPRAIDVDANGNSANGVRLIRYNVLGNCGSLFAQVEAEQLDPNGARVQYVSALIEWIIERNPSGPCAGQCGPNDLVQAVFGPKAASGCSTCGGTGRLSVDSK
jgi:hypothetical protein